jgi:hypothetical protein
LRGRWGRTSANLAVGVAFVVLISVPRKLITDKAETPLVVA